MSQEKSRKCSCHLKNKSIFGIYNNNFFKSSKFCEFHISAALSISPKSNFRATLKGNTQFINEFHGDQPGYQDR